MRQGKLTLAKFAAIVVVLMDRRQWAITRSQQEQERSLIRQVASLKSQLAQQAQDQLLTRTGLKSKSILTSNDLLNKQVAELKMLLRSQQTLDSSQQTLDSSQQTLDSSQQQRYDLLKEQLESLLVLLEPYLE
jgi:hypothetical protein